MATVTKRGKYWRAQIRRLGFPPQHKSFDTHAEAEAWARAAESEMVAHRYLTNLKGADFATYRDARRAQGRAENTIHLERALVSHLFETVRKEWGMDGPGSADHHDSRGVSSSRKRGRSGRTAAIWALDPSGRPRDAAFGESHRAGGYFFIMSAHI
jgi:hypothetical protein